MLGVASLVASLGLLIFSLGFLLLSLGLYMRLTKGVPGAVTLPRFLGGPGKAIKDLEVPPSVLRIVEEESEPWAKEELLSYAKDLYLEQGSWSGVELELERTVTDTPVPGIGEDY